MTRRKYTRDVENHSAPFHAFCLEIEWQFYFLSFLVLGNAVDFSIAYSIIAELNVYEPLYSGKTK
jgi:hypothetical protein